MARASTAIIDVVLQEMKGFLESDENLHVLNVQASDFSRMEDILGYIRKKFQDQQNKLPESIEKCLEKLKNSFEEAKYLITQAKRSQRGCFSCCLDRNSNDRIAREKKDWKRGFDDLYQQLQSLSVVAKTQTEDLARPPDLKSGHSDRPIAESAKIKSGHSDRSTAIAEPAQIKSGHSDRPIAIAESTQIKSGHYDRPIAFGESAQIKGGHSDRPIAQSAQPTELKRNASADRKQIVESTDTHKF